ncbi:uncharacterized protein LOC121385804 [Gigantopelta aegis]|uniref:uncharacterized protein LOC121385804 n=1 Tax=Gigantopelta aegis TaxID=1735272 RepID=UPI001B88C167|nr:uncharacterized protein LOC121385804 [Gigantopelta aegis]
MVFTSILVSGVLLASATLAIDLTLSPGARGGDVVAAVVDRIRSKCIFPNDRLFLRRLAYVETRDGEDSRTYRAGYHGGIWQVDSLKLMVSQTCMSRTIRECNLIQSEFGINWPRVRWAELRKPLYSGLAAAMFILTKMANQIPGDMAGQAQFWRYNFNSFGNIATFVNRAETLRDNVCTDNVIDLAFILDGSGSILPGDFTRTLVFVRNVISGLDISPSTARVAAVEYGDTVAVNFKFNQYSSKQSLLTAVSKINKRHGGTNTAAALGNVTSIIFNQLNGARPDAKHIAILLTDGVSKNVTQTIHAANDLRSKGVTVFAIGVGNVNQAELMGVASNPSCTRMFLLDNFREIDSLMYELRKSSCEAPNILGGNGVGTGGSGNSITREINNGTDKTTVVIPPDQQTGNNGDTDKVFKAEVECGSLQIYSSYDTPNPGPAFHQNKNQATDGSPAILHFTATQKGRPLYITVVGTRLDSTDKVASCVSSKYTLSIVDKSSLQVKQTTDVICRTAGIEKPCTVTDIRNSNLGNYICPVQSTPYISPTNPCTPEAVANDDLVHPHPTDVTKFIFCDVSGKMYITQCPVGEVYNASTGSCNHGTVEVTNGVSLGSDVTNPCTSANLALGNLYFPHPAYHTQFIQCDLFGKAWVMKCPPGQSWHQDLLTCSSKSQDVGRQTSVNPASLCQASGEMYTHPSDSTKFVHCTGRHRGVVQMCPASLVFSQAKRACDWP